MFDPEVAYDPRLLNELKIKSGKKGPDFYAKAECDEEELKALIGALGYQPFIRILRGIDSCPNRLVDTRNFERFNKLLITQNLDTLDQKFLRAGLSCRIRCSYDPETGEVSRFDMCIKTTVNQNIPLHMQARGEWEVKLDSLRPDMAKMIAENSKKVPPLPAFLLKMGIQDDDLFVESIGSTLRNNYTSFERFERRGIKMASVFQHTEDARNHFFTPHGDVVTGEDCEAEAEFIGILGVRQGNERDCRRGENYVLPRTFENMMRNSMRTMDRIILTSDTSIQRNDVTKSVRAREGLAKVYVPAGKPITSTSFDAAARLEFASSYALSQKVRPEEISFGNIWHHVKQAYHTLSRSGAAQSIDQENPFQHPKYQQG